MRVWSDLTRVYQKGGGSQVNLALIGKLVLKDWYLHRWLIVTLSSVAVVSAVIVPTMNPDPFPYPLALEPRVIVFLAAFNTGVINFFVAGIALPLAINNERDRGTLLFSLSGPFSHYEFLLAKLISCYVPCLFCFFSAAFILANTYGGGPRLMVEAWPMLYLCLFATFNAFTLAIRSRGYKIAVATLTVVGFVVFVVASSVNEFFVYDELWTPAFRSAVAYALIYNLLVLAAVFVAIHLNKDIA